MKIYEVRERTPEQIEALLELWGASVRATHGFLSDGEVRRIRGYVPAALPGVAHLFVAEREPGQAAAFMGIENGRLEMLFLRPEERGRGTGRRLVEYGIRDFGLREVTVNEQDPQAVGFYEHLGFQTYRRTERDEAVDPYPLLYMRLGK